MLFARIYLDPVEQQSGAMQIALGSHQHGKIPAKHLANKVRGHTIETCHAQRGDVLFAKVLIAHKSTASRSEDPIRAIRIDFSAANLPYPLIWATYST